MHGAHDGETIPTGFESQAELDLVAPRGDLRERRDDDLGSHLSPLLPRRVALDPMNVATVRRHLGDHHATRTVVCAGLLESEWLVEIEAIAAAT